MIKILSTINRRAGSVGQEYLVERIKNKNSRGGFLREEGHELVLRYVRLIG